EPLVADALDHLGEESEEPVLARVLVVEGRQQQGTGAARGEHRLGERYRIGERARAGADDAALHRQSCCRARLDEAEALRQRQRIRLAGCAERRETVAAMREQPAAM